MVGEPDSKRKLSALFGVLVMVLSVTSGTVGAETLSGGTAQAGNVGTSPGVVVNDATIYNGTDSTIEVAYDGGAADPSTLEVVLVDGNQRQIAANASLTASNGVAKLTVPAGIPTDVSVTAILADSSTDPPTQLASDTATFTAKTLKYAPWVNRTNATHDQTTDTTLDVTYNATGQVGSAADLAVTFTGGDGQTVAANASLTTTEGVAEVTVPAGTFSSDGGVAVELKDTTQGRTLAFDSFTLKASGGGGGDTAAPEISNVQFTNDSGDMYVSFESNESLGGSESDVTVTVTAPNDATYTFGRLAFVETGSGPYTYEMAVDQAFDDGQGTYSLAVTDALDAAGNNGGMNGEGSGLTASVTAGGSGGDSDTAAPNITSVDVSKGFNGKLSVVFTSNESLGTNAGDVTVTVDGPKTTDVYAFDRSQFGERYTGSGYEYSLQADQAFSEGDGYYNATVDVAKDPDGNDAGSASLNDSFMFIDPKVNSSSVSIVSGPGDEAKIDLNAFYASGLLQIQVKNDSQGYELQKAGSRRTRSWSSPSRSRASSRVRSSGTPGASTGRARRTRTGTGR